MWGNLVMQAGRSRLILAVAVVSGSLAAVLTLAGGASMTAPTWMLGLSLASLMTAMVALPVLAWQAVGAGENRLGLDAFAAICVLAAIRAVCRPESIHLQAVSVVGAIGALSATLIGRLHPR